MKTTSVEETESAVRSTFGLDYTIRQRERGPFVTQLKAHTSDAMVLLEHQFNNSFQTELVAPEGAILLLFPRPTHGSLLVAGQALSGSEVIICTDDSALEIVTTAGGAGATGILLPASRLLELSETCGRVMPDLKSKGAIIDSTRDEFESFCQAVRNLIEADGFANQESSSITIAAIFEWIARRLGSEAEKNTRDEASAVATKAREFIDGHFHNTIRAEDLCRAAGGSLRQVQRDFAKRFQITPTQYLKIVRLDAARRSLLAADPTEVTVTEVAIRCGITHLGRFSADFRAHFGELPSQALRRST